MMLELAEKYKTHVDAEVTYNCSKQASSTLGLQSLYYQIQIADIEYYDQLSRAHSE